MALSVETSGVLSRWQVGQTVDAIATVQSPNGSIPWFSGGHIDPWDHVEAAMALDVGGRHSSAERAYRWLAATQRADGAWAAAYDERGTVQDATLDANFCAYVATGVWHHYLTTYDTAFLHRMWPTVARAITFTLDLQSSAGWISWARDDCYRAWPGALLTSCSCIHLSLRCAIAMATEVASEQPDWELSAAALAEAIERCPERFEDKARFAMDWYYPVLGGVLAGDAALARLADRWDEFVVEGLGVRCVADRPWVTAGETCELVVALAAADLYREAREVFSWVQHLRAPDGSYWTGATFPDGTVWPRERPSWGSASVVLAMEALDPTSATARVFADPDRRGRLPVSEALADPL